MNRAISNPFFENLRSGNLAELLEAVHNDTSLVMELRGDRVIIYYRGGALFTVCESADGYQVSYNSAYWGIKKKYPDLSETPSIKECVDKIALYKDQMDYHLANANRTLEKQCQQRIVQENNILGKVTSGSATTGDYFILDMEYAFDKENSARFDLIALKWPSLSPNRKVRDNLGISFIEIKYYDGSMEGDSGVLKHIGDYLAFCQRPEYHDMCRDMEKVFLQKCELGLIPAYISESSGKKTRISINDEDVDCVFIFANRDPDSTLAKRELSKAIEKYGAEATKSIYVATASDMGYVLFRYGDKGKRDRYIPIADYVEM